MVGIPGQTYASIADDIDLFRGMDMDMIGIGPYLPHPATPLGDGARAAQRGGRLAGPTRRPTTSSPRARSSPSHDSRARTRTSPRPPRCRSSTRTRGRTHGLQRGANVVMPNLTPPEYRVKYEIYPEKAAVHETAEAIDASIQGLLATLGRTVERALAAVLRPSARRGDAD